MISVFLADFMAGWVGGILCVVTGHPLDTLKTRQQNFSTSLLIAAKETYKYEGMLGFYRGMAAPLIISGPSNSVFFGCYGALFEILNGSDPSAPTRVHRKETFYTNLFLSGCIGGLIQAFLMCPVELVKISLQTSIEHPWIHNYNTLKYEGVMQTYKTIIKLKGFKGLYKGFVPMVIRDVPTSGIYFIVYEGLLPGDKTDAQWYHKLWAGGWAGIASISTVLPADVVKTRIQADDILYPAYHGVRDCIKKLYLEKGSSIFWKGLPVITLRAFPAHAMLFFGYEITMDKLLHRNN